MIVSVATCTIVWVRESKTQRLITIEHELGLELKKIAGQDRNERALNEIFCPPHSTLPSCFTKC